MVEPKGNVDSLVPFASEAKAAFSMFKDKRPVKTNGSHQSYLLDESTKHIDSYHSLGSQTVVGSSHLTERTVALESELQRAHEEINKLKEQLAVSERAKAQALTEFTNIKSLLDHISLVEHFAASDDVEVEAVPLPSNWREDSSGQLDTALHKEVERLNNELEDAKNLNLKFAADLDNAKHEIERVRYETTSLQLEDSRTEISRLQSVLAAERDQHRSVYLELEIVKKNVSTLQATLSDVRSHHDTCSLELARAKEEITWLEADLQAAQNLTVELAHAKDNIHVLHEGIEVAQRLQKSSSMELYEVKEEISRLRSQYEFSSSELATALRDNNALEAELEDLRGLHEASYMDILVARNETLGIHADYEASLSACADAKEEIHRLQDELTAALARCEECTTELKSTKEELHNVQKTLQHGIGQYDTIFNELSEAKGGMEKLRAELRALHEEYETCSSALFSANKDICRLEAEQLANRENFATDIKIAHEDNLKLQTELTALEAAKDILTADLAKEREEIKYVQTELEAACKELFSAGIEITRLCGELSASQGQHEKCRKELATLKDVPVDSEFELTQIKELYNIVLAMLISVIEEIAKLQLVYTEEFESSLEVVRGLKEDIREVQADVKLDFNTLILATSLSEKKIGELTVELMAANDLVEKATAAQMKSETKPAASISRDIVATCTLCADLEAVRGDLVTARKAESKLEGMTLELEELRSQIKDVEAKYRETVNSSQAEINDLKTQLYALKDAEAKSKESSVATSAELQKVKDELVITKQAVDWVGGEAAALCAQVEALKAEASTSKEGEARAKAAFMDYSLKLQRMKIDLEDASKLADKVPIEAQPIKTQARTFKLDLDEATAKLQKANEAERTMAASMADLRADLNNTRAELTAIREDNGVALAEKDHQYEMKLNQMRAQLEAAVISETTLKDANLALNESLTKVIAEAEEATFHAGQATEEAERSRLEVEEAQAHIETIDAKLQALQLEVDTVKASEEWAFAQMRLKTIPEFYGMKRGEEQGGEISMSLEEYQNLTTKTRDLQELVNKRAAVGMAQVDAAKASEREMRRKVEILEKEVRACRIELDEAVTKREEAEAAKFSCEAALRVKRMEGKSLSFSGALNGGHPMDRLITGERQGSMNSTCTLEDSQSSSPSRSSFSFASGASPGRQERSPVESSGQPVMTTKTQSGEKQKKVKLSSKIGAYFIKRKDSTRK